MCRARFNAFIRADRVATGTKIPGTPTAPTTPAVEAAKASAPLSPEVEEAEEIPQAMHDEVETEDLEGVDPADLPFSAGIPPGSSEALVGKIAFTLDATQPI